MPHGDVLRGSHESCSDDIGGRSLIATRHGQLARQRRADGRARRSARRGRLPRCASSAGGRGRTRRRTWSAVAGPARAGRAGAVRAPRRGAVRGPARLDARSARASPSTATASTGAAPRDMKVFLAQCVARGVAARPRGAAPARRLRLHRGRGDRLPRRRAARARARRAARRRPAAGARLDRRADLVAGRCTRTRASPRSASPCAAAAGTAACRPRASNAIAVAAQALAVVGELQAELRRQPRARVRRASSPTRRTRRSTSARCRAARRRNVIAEQCSFTRELPAAARRRPGSGAARGEEASRRARVPRLGLGARGRGRRSPTRWSRRACSRRAGTSLERALREQLRPERAGGAPFCTDGGRFAAGGHRVADLRPRRARAGAPARRERVARRVRERHGAHPARDRAALRLSVSPARRSAARRRPGRRAAPRARGRRATRRAAGCDTARAGSAGRRARSRRGPQSVRSRRPADCTTRIMPGSA